MRSHGQLAASLERADTRIDDMEVAIAAHAVAIDATLVTANEKRFRCIQRLRFENWAR